MSSWVPVEQTASHLLSVTTSLMRGEAATQQYLYEEYGKLQSMPDFANYLAYIYNGCPGANVEVNTNIRLLCCGQLRQYLSSRTTPLDTNLLAYLLNTLYPSLFAEDSTQRKMIASVMAAICICQKLQDCQQLISQFIQLCQDSNTKYSQSSAVTIFLELIQSFTDDDDTASLLLQYETAPGVQFMKQLLPIFASLLSHADAEIRLNVLKCLDCLFPYMSSVILAHMNDLCTAILQQLQLEKDVVVIQEIFSVLYTIIMIQKSYLIPSIPGLCEYCIHCLQFSSPKLTMAICDFLTAILGNGTCSTGSELLVIQKAITNILPQLIPILAKKVVYTEEDIVLMAHELTNDANVDDRDQDIRPKNYDSKDRYDDEDDDGNGDDDDDDDSTEWTQRKAAGTLFNTLASLYTKQILPLVEPVLMEMMNDSNYLCREGALLILGTMVKAYDGTLSPALMTSLINLLLDQHVLLRSTAAWCIGNYGEFFIENTDKVYIEQYLTNIVKCIHDQNKKVQYAACCSLATFAGIIDEELISYSIPLLSSLLSAIPLYKAKNIPSLLDAIQCVVSNLDTYMNTPEIQRSFVEPFITMFTQLHVHSHGIADWLICMYSIVAPSNNLEYYAVGILEKTLNILQDSYTELRSEYDSYPAGPLNDNMANIFAASCDLLCAIITNLNNAFAQIKINNNTISPIYGILDIFARAMQMDKVILYQPIYAVIGDLARTCTTSIPIDFYSSCLQKGQELISVDASLESLTNNVCWAIGEIAVALGNAITPYIEKVCAKLSGILVSDISVVSHTLHICAATTYGKLALAVPQVVGTVLTPIFNTWCFWTSKIKTNSEKATTIQGIINVLKQHPQVCQTHGLGPFLQCIASWKKISHSLLQSTGEVLHEMKNTNLGTWQQYWNTAPEEIKQQFAQMYGL